MRVHRSLLPLLVSAVLALCLAGSFATRGAMANLAFLRAHQASANADLVDQRPLQTAKALYPLAVSAEEQSFALEALRLADHEVDQAFAMALREANSDNRTLSGGALEAQAKVTALQGTLQQDQALVDSLTSAAKAHPTTSGDDNDLDIAKAQLALDTDELADAQTDLATASGDQRGKIKEELATHEAGMKKYDDLMSGAKGTGQVAVISSQRYGTLAGRVRGWFEQRSRAALLEQARVQAEADAQTLTAKLAPAEAKLAALANPTGTQQTASRLLTLRRLEARRGILSILTDRIAGEKQMVANYSKWQAQLELQHRIVVHLMLNSLAWIAAIVLGAVLLGTLTSSVLERRLVQKTDAEQRGIHTLRTILHLVLQVAAALLILLVVFGAPSQVPTILGLATAGLTVVFQDFILAFFGWFVLMGRNGIRVGDWVEIDGVGGEVVEIGLFRTALLESGNWTDKGHPTGRRITFVNKFAVSGQYFNFSTTGQWMWDEIQVNVPAGEDAYKSIEQIHHKVVEETAADTALAEGEWQRATRQHGMSQFTATPSVDMRPAASGVDLVVRYVTRAGARFETRNRLYQAVIGLLHTGGPAGEAAAKAS